MSEHNIDESLKIYETSDGLRKGIKITLRIEAAADAGISDEEYKTMMKNKLRRLMVADMRPRPSIGLVPAGRLMNGGREMGRFKMIPIMELEDDEVFVPYRFLHYILQGEARLEYAGFPAQEMSVTQTDNSTQSTVGVDMTQWQSIPVLGGWIRSTDAEGQAQWRLREAPRAQEWRQTEWEGERVWMYGTEPDVYRFQTRAEAERARTEMGQRREADRLITDLHEQQRGTSPFIPPEAGRVSIDRLVRDTKMGT